MQNNPLVSVIMPVYRVENSLETAVNSILGQTYESVELILVDDCSPDACPQMCDNFALLDQRISVVHKPENEGLGYARNTGLAVAKGKYVLFIDSDDWLERDALEKLVATIEKTNASAVAFGFFHDYVDDKGNLKKRDEVKLLGVVAECAYDIACLAIDMDKRRNFAYAWSKLYSKEFLDKRGLLFDKTKLMEDFVFNIAVFEKATKVVTVDDVFYHYIRPPHTTLASTYSPEFFELCKMRYLKQEALLKKGGIEENSPHYQIIRDIFIKHILSVFVRNSSKKSGLTWKEKYKKASVVLTDDLIMDVLSKSHTGSRSVKILESVFKRRWVVASLLLTFVYTTLKR